MAVALKISLLTTAIVLSLLGFSDNDEGNSKRINIAGAVCTYALLWLSVMTI